ncbi:unnamed protein product [Ectocarpus sp. CCAP 1310/34]|nr:unnamed protein product [Ectocarpus sp. CCAP 1310/34]
MSKQAADGTQPLKLHECRPFCDVHGRTLLGAGVSPLKNPVKDYPGYTGAQKALFGSVQLIVLRGLLLSTATMVRVFGSEPNEIASMNTDLPKSAF